MAEDKKSFIMYADFIHAFENLEDDEAGRLIKHLLRYVNDLNPEYPDKITKIAFEPIKQQLKRDLKEWEQTRGYRSASGRKGGLKSGESRRLKQNEAKRSNASKNEANEAVTVNVTVTDNVTEESTLFLRLRGKIIQGLVSEYFQKNNPIFLENWQIKHQDTAFAAVLKKMDQEFICHEFRDENHLRNAFKSCYEKLIREKNKNNGTSNKHQRALSDF
jgi:hypothetical protein